MRLAAVGDLSLSPRVVRNRGRLLGEAVASVLDDCDLRLANLECALSSRPSGAFVAAPSDAVRLEDAGFTHLHLANNHIYDAGAAGLRETLQSLDRAGIVGLGAGENDEEAGELRIDRCHGLSIGWLAAGRTGTEQSANGPHFNELHFEALLDSVASARGRTDVLIVSLHLGFMYVDFPDPDHRAYAKSLAQAGADLVLMHHPHVLQGVEVLESGSVVCYSLGNFLVDWTAGFLQHDIRVSEQTEGAVFLFDLDERGVQRVKAVPTRITPHCSVELATGEHAQAIVDRLDHISRALEGNYAGEYRRQRAAFNTRLGLRSLLSLLRGRQYRAFWSMLRRARLSHLRMLLRWMTGTAGKPA